MSSLAEISIENANPFVLNGQGLNITTEEPLTKVVVSKIIQGKIGESKLETIIKIKTPKLVSLDFVLALDSSGSMGEGGDPELGKIIKEVIPDVLRSINTENKKINVSTILWNKGIDNIPRFLDIYNSSLDFNNLPFNPTEDKESNLDVGVNKSVKFLNDNKPNNLVKTRRFIIFVTSRVNSKTTLMIHYE